MQILPNVYHPLVSFEAEKVYRLPQCGKFTIPVSPPALGTERITVYAATAPLQDQDEIVPTGAVDGSATRSNAAQGAQQKVVEYTETSATLTTRAK